MQTKLILFFIFCTLLFTAYAKSYSKTDSEGDWITEGFSRNIQINFDEEVFKRTKKAAPRNNQGTAYYIRGISKRHP